MARVFAAAHLPGLVALVTSGGGGLVRVGGLGGAASGASDMVDGGDALMRRGDAASDRGREIGKRPSVGPRGCAGGSVRGCLRALVSLALLLQLDVSLQETNSHRTT